MNCFIARPHDDLWTYVWFVFLYWPFVTFIIRLFTCLESDITRSFLHCIIWNQIKPTINNNYILYVIFCETMKQWNEEKLTVMYLNGFSLIPICTKIYTYVIFEGKNNAIDAYICRSIKISNAHSKIIFQGRITLIHC